MKNSSVNKIKAKLTFHNVSDADAQQRFLAVLKGLKGNPAFPNTPVDIATYEKGVDSFGTLLTDAQDGGKKAISPKNKQLVPTTAIMTGAAIASGHVPVKMGPLSRCRRHSPPFQGGVWSLAIWDG